MNTTINEIVLVSLKVAIGMAYKQLRSLYYQDDSAERKSHLERLLSERRDGEFGTVLSLALNGEPFFFTTPPEMSQMIEGILRRERKVSNLYKSMPSIIGAAVLRSMVWTRWF